MLKTDTTNQKRSDLNNIDCVILNLHFEIFFSLKKMMIEIPSEVF